MDVTIAGGHGKVGLLLGQRLTAEGHRVRGLIRSPAQAGDLRDLGIDPILSDLEADEDMATAVRGADAVVFAAGAGPGSGAERKQTVDLGGALKLIDAAKAEGVRRYAMLSAMGAANPPAAGGDVYGEYLRAKAEADRALEASGLDFTILRPGRLTDEDPSGRVRLGVGLGGGEVSRSDVAAVLAAVLGADNTIERSFELLAGETLIEEAVGQL